MPQDAFALNIQKELCDPKCARKVSGLSPGLSRNCLSGPNKNWEDHTLSSCWLLERSGSRSFIFFLFVCLIQIYSGRVEIELVKSQTTAERNPDITIR